MHQCASERGRIATRRRPAVLRTDGCLLLRIRPVTSREAPSVRTKDSRSTGPRPPS